MSGSLTHSPADIVRYALIDASLGTLPSDSGSWPVYVNREPDSPDSCITVYDTTGVIAAMGMDGTAHEHHGVQIRIRAARFETGFTKARALAIGLDSTIKLASITISSSVYLVWAITRVGDVLPIGREGSSDRELFTINATATLRQTT